MRMLLLGPKTDQDTWSARTRMCAYAEDVLEALTDPNRIAEWAPISFEVEGLHGERLRAGSRAQVSGSLAGIGAAFDVEVHRADSSGLELVARGPVALDVSYRIRDHDDGVLVEVAVAVQRQRGLTAQLLRTALTALMNAGALRSALRRLETSLNCPLEAELVAA
jgi:hypothetical protein